MELDIGSVFERDIDLLIIEEFISSPDFTKVILDAAGLSGHYSISEIHHSMSDADLGESDIVFILQSEESRHAIHIENKISAIAMPNQCERYFLRADKDVAEGRYSSYSIMIIAPEKYLAGNTEASKYELRLSYEQLLEYFHAIRGPRAAYKAALLSLAVASKKSTYQWHQNESVYDFCTAMNAYQVEHFPWLPVGSISWWPHRQTLISEAYIVFKANKGVCDLCFSGYSVEKLYNYAKHYISSKMSVTKTGKSASIRIRVSPICFEDIFSNHQPEVHEALCAINELYELTERLIEHYSEE